MACRWANEELAVVIVGNVVLPTRWLAASRIRLIVIFPGALPRMPGSPRELALPFPLASRPCAFVFVAVSVVIYTATMKSALVERALVPVPDSRGAMRATVTPTR